MSRKKIFFLVFHLGVPTKKEKNWWLYGGLTRKLPRANMIKYSSDILLFTKVKRAQPHVGSLCKLGYSAQFSIAAPTELNTLCFTSILIHYTSVGGDVITTKSAAIKKSVPTLQMNLNFETYRKNITKIYDLSSVILY